jgi:putative effector of murein hydrolase
METSLAGDMSLTVVLCILTGILGALVGPSMLHFLRVKDSDFVTIGECFVVDNNIVLTSDAFTGIVLGCTASAISTAALLGTNPRAAAISSLAFVLYGVICVLLASIPPVVRPFTLKLRIGLLYYTSGCACTKACRRIIELSFTNVFPLADRLYN